MNECKELQRMVNRFRGRAFVAFAALMLAASGCITEPSAHHKDVPPPPSDARATSVQIFASAPRDTNANGFGDTMAVTVYLFDEQRYPLPIAVPGALRFDLRTAKGEPISAWTFLADDVGRSLQAMAPGPGCRFELSLLERGTDIIDNQEAVLTAEFTPTTGRPVRSAGGVAMRVGKVSQ